MKWEYLTVDKTLDNQQMNDVAWHLIRVFLTLCGDECC